jgi:hypothetical protein
VVDIHRASALANVGSFLVGCGMLYLMVRQPQSPVSSKGSEPAMLSPMMWVFLAGLIVAGALHISAAFITNRRSGPIEPDEASRSSAADAAFGTTLPTLPDGREIISCSPEDLRKIYRANTIDQTNRILRGKWVRMSVEIQDNHGQGELLLKHGSPLRLVSGPLIFLKFAEGWMEQLSTLARGSKVTIRGRIRDADILHIQLVDCELL